MTWSLIDLTEEIKNRIMKAKTNGKLSCKDVFIGDYEAIRNHNDYPICVVAPTNFRGKPVCMPHGFVEDSEIKIVYIISKKSDNNNKLYRNSDMSGAFFEIAKLLNYIEKKTTDGSIDLTLNGQTHSQFKYDCSIDYSQNDLVRFFITLTVDSRKNERGTR
jgi:hypothetical protein